MLNDKYIIVLTLHKHKSLAKTFVTYVKYTYVTILLSKCKLNVNYLNNFIWI